MILGPCSSGNCGLSLDSEHTEGFALAGLLMSCQPLISCITEQQVSTAASLCRAQGTCTRGSAELRTHEFSHTVPAASMTGVKQRDRAMTAPAALAAPSPVKPRAFVFPIYSKSSLASALHTQVTSICDPCALEPSLSEGSQTPAHNTTHST